MSAPTNHWKLGLFVVVAFCMLAATVVFLGARSLRKETVKYRTYFDESVQGLEMGSPVKFRGVTIGSVSSIDVAPDHRHVEVTCEIGVKALHGLGLAERKHIGRTKMAITPELRIRLETTGITGVKFLLIDYFKQATHPPPELPFPTPDNYIPSTPSLIKNLEDSLVHAVERLPEMAAQLQKFMPAALATLDNVNVVLNDAHRAISQVDTGRLAAKTDTALTNLNVAIVNFNRTLDGLNNEKGLLRSIQRTADAVGSTAQNANHVGPALEEALREVQGAAESIRKLADSLDRDPDMLLKGRAKRKEP
jgi:phospholipid/cholesterol/gamma-HCH transport system substrate-binding protein